MSDLAEGHSDTEAEIVFSDQEIENSGNSSSDSSEIPSPIDNDLVDPNFVCTTTQADSPTPIRTRRTRRNSTGTIQTHSPEPPRTYNIFLTDAENRATQANSTAGATGTNTTATSNKSKAKAAKKITKMDAEMKAAFKKMADSFKEVGQQAKQNSTSFLGDLPY